MCNFVPRECIAFGHLAEMQELITDWRIPGTVQPIPLLPEGVEYMNPKPFDGYGFLHVTNIPDGLEVLAVSKLSAALSPLIGGNKAVAELNAYLPLGTAEPSDQEPFSPVAQCLIDRLNAVIKLETSQPRAVAVLDSGIDPDAMRLYEDRSQPELGRSTRRLIAFDYVNEEIPGPVDPCQITDSLAHGSVVYRILDALLPREVPLVVGRVVRWRSDDVTVLYLARCYAHIVAAQMPAVVNLSLAPLRDYIVCPHCDHDVPVDGFHTLMLPRVFQLAADTTWTIMAAGNKGKACNADHNLANTEKLIYATAVDSSNCLASYSNYIEGDNACSLAAFGGDPAEMESGQGVLMGERRLAGTSFAAPFVSATVWAAEQQGLQKENLVDYCRSILGEDR